MSDYNHVGISGRLTKDAVLKYLQSGTAVCEFGLASNRRFKDKEETTFVDVTLWGKQAESLSEYLVKGKSVIVSGRLRLESWENDGNKRSKISINADTVDFLSSGPVESKSVEVDPSEKQEVKNEPVASAIDENIPF